MTRAKARATETVKVYNSTDGPLPYDAEGRVIPARESAEVPVQLVDEDPITGHVDAGRFIVAAPKAAATETDTSTDATGSVAGDAGQTEE